MHWLGPNIEWLLFVKMSKMPQYLKFYMDWILVTKDLLAVEDCLLRLLLLCLTPRGELYQGQLQW